MMKFIQKITKDLTKRSFCTQANSKSTFSYHKTLVINQNLKFDAKKYDLFFIPSHPKITAKGLNYIEIDSEQPVLQLAFVKKSHQDDFALNWQRKVQFQFRFKDLHQILDIELGSGVGKAFKVQDKDQNQNIYKIMDVKDRKEIDFYYQPKPKSSSQFLNAGSISYSQFALLQDMLKESLFDLSGLRFMFEKKRQDQIAAIRKDLKILKEREEEAKSFYQ